MVNGTYYQIFTVEPIEGMPEPDLKALGIGNGYSLTPEYFMDAVIAECLVHFIIDVDSDPAKSLYVRTLAREVIEFRGTAPA